jgi:hypothetical protein
MKESEREMNLFSFLLFEILFFFFFFHHFFLTEWID